MAFKYLQGQTLQLSWADCASSQSPTMVKRCFLIFRGRVQYFNFCPLALVLSLATSGKSFCPICTVSSVQIDPLVPSLFWAELNTASYHSSLQKHMLARQPLFLLCFVSTIFRTMIPHL